MRRCFPFGSVALSGALFALFATGCGHAISIPDWRTLNVASNGDAGTGAKPFDVLIEELPPEDADAGADADAGTVGTVVGTGPCPAKSVANEPTLPGATWTRDPAVDSLLSSMSSADKILQMYGVPDPKGRDSAAYGNIEQSQDVTDLSSGQTLRGLKYRDAGRGVNLDARQPNNRPTDQNNYQSYSTAFPTESARAASWDPDFEMSVGEAMGDEVMGSLNNMLLAPCMNILRHPYWGRSQETYGEDMYQIGRMASALTAGIQEHVIATAKHYAANNIENGRAAQDALMDEQTLREVYVQHFAMVVQQGGVGCVMAAYNSVNQTKCTQNSHLLHDILKGDLGFRGFVVSDWWAMPGGDAHASDTGLATSQTIEAVNAGLDVELPWSLHFAQLPNVLNNGVSQTQLNDSVGRILEQKYRFGIAYPTRANDPKSGPWGLGTATTTIGGQYNDSLTGIQKHLALAAESEVRSAVLLSNGTGNTPVLPISAVNANMKIAVVGLDWTMSIATSTNLQPGGSNVLHFATDINTGDRGSSRVNSDPASSIGPFAGIQMAAVSHSIASTNVTSGNSVDAANGADLIVVVVGLTAGDEGEEYSVATHGDRANLDLPGSQSDFVNTVLSLNKPTVIIIESGSIVNVPWLNNSNQQQATIWAGYSGQYGGKAYGQLLFGDRNFSGKLAVSWPQQTDLDDLLPFRDPSTQTVTMPYFHGYRLWDQNPQVKLVFPFGWGMSYTTFAYSNLRVPCGTAKKTDVVYVTADIANTGSVAGDEVMMLFVQGPKPPSTVSPYRPVKELKRFQRVNGIQPAGQAKSHYRVTFPIRIQDLEHWQGDASGKWVVDSGDYTIMVGPNSANLPLTGKLTVQGD
jgi:beta-glucosidase